MRSKQRERERERHTTHTLHTHTHPHTHTPTHPHTHTPTHPHTHTPTHPHTHTPTHPHTPTHTPPPHTPTPHTPTHTPTHESTHARVYRYIDIHTYRIFQRPSGNQTLRRLRAQKRWRLLDPGPRLWHFFWPQYAKVQGLGFRVWGLGLGGGLGGNCIHMLHTLFPYAGFVFVSRQQRSCAKSTAPRVASRCYVHTYIHTYIHTCMHAYIHTSIHAYIHTCIHACMRTCTHMHTCMYACMHVCMHTYIHTYICTSIHTYRSLHVRLGGLEKFALFGLVVFRRLLRVFSGLGVKSFGIHASAVVPGHLEATQITRPLVEDSRTLWRS